MKEETKVDEIRLKQLLAIIVALIVAWVLFGCSVDKKAQKKVSWLLAHDKMDDACSRLYPNLDSTTHKDSVHFDTLYLENDPVIKTDTLYRNDTVFITQTVKCPPDKVITIHKVDTVTVYRTNTAEVERWKGEVLTKEGQIKAKDDIIIKQQQKIDNEDKWKVWFIILASLNVLAFVVRFFVIKRPI
jgi:hypothetical protein